MVRRLHFWVFENELCIKKSSHPSYVTLFGEHYRDRAESWQPLALVMLIWQSSMFLALVLPQCH